MASPSPPLPDTLGRQAGSVNLVLFSQDACAYCQIVREHYLRPLAASRPDGLQIAEIELGGRRTMLDWQGTRRSHAEMGRAHGVRFAPTVMFLDSQGRELAPAIVGLSNDFFGAYLEARIAAAKAALRASAAAARSSSS